MNLAFYSFIFILGTLFGSFLNCVIHRLKTGETLGGNSYCPSCKHKLSFFDLIPVFSFLFLKGKCRYCRQKISIQYPLVEIITGIVFLITFLNYPLFFTPTAIISLGLLLSIFLLLIVVFVYDLKHYIIPNKIIYPALFLAFAHHLFRVETLISWEFLNVLASGLATFLFFFSIYILTKGKGIGFGDVRYAGFMGLFLGFPDILAGLFFSFLIGAIIGIGLIISGIKGRKDMVPFGPFLVTGTFVAFFLGETIIKFYLSLL